MGASIPKNVKGWEYVYAACKKAKASFNFTAPVPDDDPCWRTHA